MNTNQLKTFAQKARNIIRNGVATRLKYWGFDEKGNITHRPEKVEGGIIHREEVLDDPSLMKLWLALSQAVKHQGFDQVVEVAAYTWFNRVMAIRILSKNGYDQPQLEYGDSGARIPLILQRARRGHFSFLSPAEQERLQPLIADYARETHAFAILLTGYCHAQSLLNSVFGRLDDYTELLLPTDMLAESGFIHYLNTTPAISDDDYRKVELIGWLYQFYISERKDEVFKQFKKNKKAEAKDIPAATQIFTPNWIVKYMVENTVGKIWLDQHPDSPLRTKMKYLVEPSPLQGGAEGGESLISEIAQLKLLDPAAGSGHILVEGFDLLYEMYLEEYYMPAEAVESILKNNLFGLDIDLRAAQLARFALLMKAAAKYPAILKKNILPRVFAMPEPALFSRQEILDFLGSDGLKYEDHLARALQLMQQAQNLGSAMRFDIAESERAFLLKRLESLRDKPFRDTLEEALLHKIEPFIEVIALLTNRYEAIAANPPYMGQGNMNGELKDYINSHYPLSKSDLFAVFMEVCLNLNVPSGLMGMINQHSWMFLSSYEKLRLEILKNYGIRNMLHLGPRTFEELSGEVVQSTAFVLAKEAKQQTGTYFRLVDYRNNEEKEAHFLKRNHQFPNIPQSNFSKIPGSPIAYWVSENGINTFSTNLSVSDSFDTKQGLATCNNGLFVRFWHEVSSGKIGFNLDRENAIISDFKWFPYNKGGGFRKWYGLNQFIVNWWKNGKDIHSYNKIPLTFSGAPVRAKQFYFKEGLTYNLISSGGAFASRYISKGFVFDVGGSMIFPCNENSSLMNLLGLSNSKLFSFYFNILNPTFNYQVGDINKIPLAESNAQMSIKEQIKIAKVDWDSRETSWDFKTTPLFDALLGDIGLATSQFAKSRLQNALRDGVSLQKVVEDYMAQWSSLFYQLHANEEELNRIFIDIYGLNEELDPIVPLKDITILQDELDEKALEKTDKALRKRRQWNRVGGHWELLVDESKPLPELPVKRDVVMKQFISYAIGCMMGRFSLDKPGLILASQGESLDDYFRIIGCGDFQIADSSPLGGDKRGASFPPDDDAIIPLMGPACTFADDAVNRFNQFLEVVWGANTLTENKNFLQECLDQEIEKYLVRDFWKDHCKTYKKKPIYWLFSSEKGAFQVLVYMHRMNRFTAEKIRSKYLLKHLQHLQQEIALLDGQAGLSREEQRRLDTLHAQYDECRRYELLLKDCADRQINFDLDDGVSANYELFAGVVAPIK